MGRANPIIARVDVARAKERKFLASVDEIFMDSAVVKILYKLQTEIEKLGEESIDNGRWEEFYQKGDRRGNGKNSYMQEYHKNLRLKQENRLRELQAVKVASQNN